MESDATMTAENLKLDLNSILANLGVGWKLSADAVRQQADQQYEKDRRDNELYKLDAGLLVHAQQQRDYAYQVSFYLDRASSQATGASPALLFTNNPHLLRHDAVRELQRQVGPIYNAALAQGRVLEDQPPPPPAPIVPVEQPESRDGQITREIHEKMIRETVEVVRSIGVQHVELSAVLCRDPVAMKRIQDAQAEYSRRLTAPGT